MRLTHVAIAAAPMLFVLLWSTGFIGARFGLPYIEPMTFLAVRMIFVVAIMAAIALIARARWPRGAEIGHSLVAGSLVHGLYLGGVFTAISQGVPAGISAMIPGLQPILTSTIASRFMGEKVTRVQWLGLALGLIGVCWCCTIAAWWRGARCWAGARDSARCSASRSARSTRNASAERSTGAPATPCNMPAPARCSGSAPSPSRRA